MKRLERNTRPKVSNPARKRREFARAYHSVERVEFVKSLPCAACGIEGYSQNAHIRKKGNSAGMGYKGPSTDVAPLCGPHFSRNAPSVLVPGCHALVDELWGRGSVEAQFKVDLDAAAAETEAKWQSHVSHQEAR